MKLETACGLHVLKTFINYANKIIRKVKNNDVCLLHYTGLDLSNLYIYFFYIYNFLILFLMDGQRVLLSHFWLIKMEFTVLLLGRVEGYIG